MNKYLVRSLLLLVVVSNLLVSCSMFGGDDDEELEPAKLTKFDVDVQLRRVWSADVGNGQGDKYNRLNPVLNQDVIYAASNNGNIVALDRNSGRRLWRQKLKNVTITGGLGFGEGMVLFGTEDSSVVALNSENGEMLWEHTVSSEVLSSPQAAGGKVIVQTIDGKLQALDAATGDSLWLYENTVPALSIRGTGSPLIIDNFVIAGFGNGTLVSVAVDNGTLRWEQRVALPTGRSDIDRLVDVDADIFLTENGALIVPSYQGYLVAIDSQTGQIGWRVKESSIHEVSSGFGNIYTASDGGEVTARRPNQDDDVWKNSDLLRRNLSAPLSFNNYVIVGDFEGYLHLLSQVDGSMAGREKVDGKGLRAKMLTRDNTLYVYGNSGKLVAYRIR